MLSLFCPWLMCTVIKHDEDGHFGYLWFQIPRGSKSSLQLAYTATVQ